MTLEGKQQAEERRLESEAARVVGAVRESAAARDAACRRGEEAVRAMGAANEAERAERDQFAALVRARVCECACLRSTDRTNERMD